MNKAREKYDHLLPPDLLNAAYAARSLDPAAAWQCLREILRQTATMPERGVLD